MVDSWYCLDRVVPEGTSQVSRRSEVGNHTLRTLHTQVEIICDLPFGFLINYILSLSRLTLYTQLSSGTSAGTFAVSAGP